jgi:hypothetical protein
MEMNGELPFSWDDIHRYFPKEEVARLRKELMEEYRSGEHTDKELMERYRMSKQTFYETIERYKDAVELSDFMDESKAPKNPYRKFLPEHEEKVKELVMEDREALKKSNCNSKMT